MTDQDDDSISALSQIPWIGPAIMLVDLDAFFASVEQLDHPEWRGKPVIVGGDAKKRGVVSTASYEARKYGVHSAMPSSTAARLCPEAIWTPGHFSRYRELSNAVMDILFNETPHVQQVSIDEAFLDVTPTSINREHPVLIAKRIQDRVSELGITCSVGLGSSKSLAKMASDMDKPKGLTIVLPGSELNFIEQMPIRALSGIGPSLEKKINARGITTLGELYRVEDEPFIQAFGKVGQVILNRVRGTEDTLVRPDDEVKSVSSETSFAQNVSNRADLLAQANTMAAKVGRRLRRKGLKGSTLTLKVRFDNLTSRTAQVKLPTPSDDEYLFQEYLPNLLEELWEPGIELRLIGVAVTGFDADAPDGIEQPSLFDASSPESPERSEIKLDHSTLLSATDRVKERFGEDMLIYGRELRLRDSSTGSSSKNPADYK